MRLAGVLASGLAVSACVVGTDRPVSRVDIARAATGEASAAPETGTAARCQGRGTSQPPSPGPGAVWVDGFCHFDGVRYVFVQGRWERP